MDSGGRWYSIWKLLWRSQSVAPFEWHAQVWLINNIFRFHIVTKRPAAWLGSNGELGVEKCSEEARRLFFFVTMGESRQLIGLHFFTISKCKSPGGKKKRRNQAEENSNPVFIFCPSLANQIVRGCMSSQHRCQLLEVEFGSRNALLELRGFLQSRKPIFMGF